MGNFLFLFSRVLWRLRTFSQQLFFFFFFSIAR
jgi:hypothetical protein